MPLVTIITANYNGAAFLNEAACSVFTQTFSDWEWIIVDDASTDESWELMNAFAKSDTRVKIFKLDKNTGSPADPRNFALQKAQGRLIAFLDSDDVWLSKKLEKQIVLWQETQAAVVFSGYEKIDERGRGEHPRVISVPEKVNYQKLLKSNVIRFSSAIFDTEKAQNPRFLNVGHEDFVFWLDILKQGHEAVAVQEVLMLYREHKNSLSFNKKRALAWQWNIYRNIEQLGFFKSLWCFFHYAYFGFLKVRV